MAGKHIAEPMRATVGVVFFVWADRFMKARVVSVERVQGTCGWLSCSLTACVSLRGGNTSPRKAAKVLMFIGCSLVCD